MDNEYPKQKRSYDWWKRVTAAERTTEERDIHPLQLFVERLFKIRHRNTSISKEIKCGILHFVSCSFILAVNPTLLSTTQGSSRGAIAGATAISAGVSCLLCGLFANLPFVLAPTTSTSLYYSLYLQNRSVSNNDGKLAVFLLGILYALGGIRFVAKSIGNLIPFVLKVGICLGVALLIALEALTEIGLVRSGEYTVLDIGNFNDEIYIAMFAFVGIGISLHFRVRGAFLIGLVFGSVAYSLYGFITGQNVFHLSYSSVFIQNGDISISLSGLSWDKLSNSKIYRLIFDLYIIGIILLNGLSHGLAETADLRREDDSLPRGKWLYAACGIGTMLSGVLGSGPIMISPESAPGIKSGARTGLATVVCGILFLLSAIVCPIFASTPAAGTSPVLLMIGMMLFENAKNVNWSTIKEALPVFIMVTFIPFTYSIFNGVIFGFGMYFILLIITEYPQFRKKLRRIYKRICKYLNPSAVYDRVHSRSSSISEDQSENSLFPRHREILGSSRLDYRIYGKGDDTETIELYTDNLNPTKETVNRRTPSQKSMKIEMTKDNRMNTESDEDDDVNDSSIYSLFQSTSDRVAVLSFELNEITSSNKGRGEGNIHNQDEVSDYNAFDDSNQLTQSLMSLIGDKYVSVDDEMKRFHQECEAAASTNEGADK